VNKANVVNDRQFQDLQRCPPMTAEEERALAIKMRAGSKKARAEFIQRNMRLVFAAAKRMRRSSSTLEERISSGHIGLIRAVDKFDPDRGCRFCTMATYWIWQEIRRASAEERNQIHIPARYADSSKLRGPEQQWLYLDAPIGSSPSDPHPLTLHDVLPSDDPPPSAAIDAFETRRDARRLLASLGHREREILKRRFGFYEDREECLREIGQRWGLTRERIRQIESAALAKLRHAAGAKRAA
jgi:RNA polymerase primary sigma factor